MSIAGLHSDPVLFNLPNRLLFLQSFLLFSPKLGEGKPWAPRDPPLDLPLTLAVYQVVQIILPSTIIIIIIITSSSIIDLFVTQ